MRMLSSSAAGLELAHVELPVTRAWSVPSTGRDSLRPRDALKRVAAVVLNCVGRVKEPDATLKDGATKPDRINIKTNDL